jgi:CRP-like cAMP-binding protein
MDAVTADAIGDKADAIKFFSAVALFRDVPEAELAHLLPMVRIQHFKNGDVILREGDATNDFLIVREGFVEVYVNKGDKKIHITLLGPTSYFGEMSVFDEYPRSASVAATSEVVTFRVDREAFRSFLKTNAAALYQMCTVFSHRLRNTNSALARR